MKLSVIIPVYNEEKTIEEILKRVSRVKLPKGMEKEIVVIDDGSTDQTKEILSKKLAGADKIKFFRHPRNQGKGAAIQTGLKRAKGELLIIQDADLEYNPQNYRKLLKPILENQTEVVYGSRLMNLKFRLSGRNKTPLPFHYFANKLLSLTTTLLYGTKITDMETGYKLFTRKVIKRIKIKANRFDFEPEITAQILKKGFSIKEIPIKIKPRGYKEGKKISWRDGFKALIVLIKYRMTD